jgi:hypothetical protein
MARARLDELSIDPDRREILALRAGFDVLFGGFKTHEVRTRLSELLDEENGPSFAARMG